MSLVRLTPALALALAACAPHTPPEGGAPAHTLARDDCPHDVQILHLNDTYRIESLLDGSGGMAKVRALRQELSGCGPVIVTHAGDLLSPSLLSKRFAGEQMVDALNHLDGAGGSFDPLMVATFGNHEFDRDDLEEAAVLDARVDQSGFVWLDTNIAWKAGSDGAPLVDADHLREWTIVDAGGLRVGFFSITTPDKKPAYVQEIEAPSSATVALYSQKLRAEGADVVIAITHLDLDQDEALTAGLEPRERPDLILGGHDHAVTDGDADGVPVVKGDADAVRVRIVGLDRAEDGSIAVRVQPAPVAVAAYAPDPVVQARVDDWTARFDAAFCGEADPTCLSETLTVTRTALVGREDEIRRYETALGNLVADAMLDSYRAQGAQVALVNSGSLRLGQDVPAGATLTRRVLEELMPYPSDLRLVELTGEELARVAELSVRGWTGSGHFLQVAGLAFRWDPKGATARPRYLTLLTADGPVRVEPEMRVRVVVPRYLVDPSIGDQDGYGAVLTPDKVVDAPPATAKDAVLRAWTAAGEQGIAPAVEGRICNMRREGPCLAPMD